MGEYGHGLGHLGPDQPSDDVVATALGDNGAHRDHPGQQPAREPRRRPGPGDRRAVLEPDRLAAEPRARPAVPRSGSATRREPRRSAPRWSSRSGRQGPTDAAGGLAAGGDVAGDAAVAWVQGAAASSEIVVDAAVPAAGRRSRRGATLALPEHPEPDAQLDARRSEPWGPITYTVSSTGPRSARPGDLAVRVPTALADGPHTWQVTATNPAGQTTHGRKAATVFVDTVPPTGAMTGCPGAPAAGSIAARVRHLRRPAAGGRAAQRASGVANVVGPLGRRNGRPARRSGRTAASTRIRAPGAT